MVNIRKQSDSLIDLACCTFELSDESRITVKFSSPHGHTLKEPRRDFITKRLFLFTTPHNQLKTICFGEMKVCLE